MDTKKTNLTPELKEIYDRVMNTSATPQTSTPKATAEPFQPSVPPPPVQPATSTNLPPQPNAAATPPTGAAPQQQSATTPASPAMPPIEAPSMPSMPASAEEALTSTPARPLNEGNTFSFSGNTPTSAIMNAPQAAAAKAPKGKIKLTVPLLIGIGVVFIAVWGVFWAIILGFIKH